MPSTVLVTGATGWLGRHVLDALARLHDVTVIAAARDVARVPARFAAGARIGDLTDRAYRRSVVTDVDVVIHAGTWSSFWGHAGQERSLFLEPSIDLLTAPSRPVPGASSSPPPSPSARRLTPARSFQPPMLPWHGATGLTSTRWSPSSSTPRGSPERGPGPRQSCRHAWVTSWAPGCRWASSPRWFLG